MTTDKIAEALAGKWPRFPFKTFTDMRGVSAEEVAAVLIPIVAEREATVLREHREGWASWIESHGQYVGTTELTQAEIVAALRWERPPFGWAAGDAIEARDD